MIKTSNRGAALLRLCVLLWPCGGRDAGTLNRSTARASAVADQSGRGTDGESCLRRADDRSPWRWRRRTWRRRRWFPRRWRWRWLSRRRRLPWRWRISRRRRSFPRRGGGPVFHGGGFRTGAAVFHGGGLRAGPVFHGGGYRYGGTRFGGYRFAHHRHFHGHFFYGASYYYRYYDYPDYYSYRRCRMIWTYYGPRRICHYRHWRTTTTALAPPLLASSRLVAMIV